MIRDKEVKIFISCHKPSIVPRDSVFQPIQVGAALSDNRLEMLHDDEGDNISQNNKMYCELTAQYWAWKNISADYYGFCHYRRFFSFSDEPIPQNMYGTWEYDILSEKIQEELCMDSEHIHEKVKNYDILLAEGDDLQALKFANLYEQYDSGPELHVRDLKLAIDIVKEKYPSYAPAVEEYMNGDTFYPCNMFIMRKECFQEYCDWLFDILGEIEKRCDWSDYSVEGKRFIGHIAERLLGIYFTKKKNDGLKVGTLQWAIMNNTDPFTLPEPAFSNNNIPVVFCCSNQFVPYAAITIQSLIDNSNTVNNYDLIFLHTSIDNYNQQKLLSLVKDNDNISLRFINVLQLSHDLTLVANHHISIESMYRLLIPDIFINYKRLVYLDCDLLVLHDVADLFNIDIGDSLVAATVDADHAGQYSSNYMGARDFTDSVLALKHPYQYFQAGVMVFNVCQFRKTFDSKEIMALAQKREYMYMDQDILNALCEGRVYFISENWNVMTDHTRFRMNGLIRRYAPEKIWNDYNDSRRNPYIIHYAGSEKPWKNPEMDYAFEFWSYARKSPFYEIILNRMIQYHIDCIPKNHIDCIPKTNPEKPLYKRVVSKVLPWGTHRRQIVETTYRRVFHK